MFNKPKRNFRSRRHDSESDEDLSDDSQAKDATKSTAVSVAKSGLSKTPADKGKKNSSELKAVSSANSLLSFVSNEEGMSQISVPHYRFLLKMKLCGVKGTLLDWVKNLLTERRQRVMVAGTGSHLVPVLSGVPQGSELRPLLFICEINDMPETIIIHLY